LDDIELKNTIIMVLTRRMCAVRKDRKDRKDQQKYRTPEQRNRRRKVLLECLDMLRDGFLKFQKDLEDAHRTYERNMDAILNKSRATRAVVDAKGAETAGTGSSGADAQGADAGNEKK
jgi:hypothetical protein